MIQTSHDTHAVRIATHGLQRRLFARGGIVIFYVGIIGIIASARWDLMCHTRVARLGLEQGIITIGIRDDLRLGRIHWYRARATGRLRWLPDIRVQSIQSTTECVVDLPCWMLAAAGVAIFLAASRFARPADRTIELTRRDST